MEIKIQIFHWEKYLTTIYFRFQLNCNSLQPPWTTKWREKLIFGALAFIIGLCVPHVTNICSKIYRSCISLSVQTILSGNEVFFLLIHLGLLAFSVLSYKYHSYIYISLLISLNLFALSILTIFTEKPSRLIRVDKLNSNFLATSFFSHQFCQNKSVSSFFSNQFCQKPKINLSVSSLLMFTSFVLRNISVLS